MAVIAYSRISTDKQDLEGQESRIAAYAAGAGLTIDTWERETVSSRKKDRLIVGIVQGLRPGDILIVSEVSRLGRSGMIELAGLIGQIQDRQAGLIVCSENIRIMPGEDLTITAQALLMALSIGSTIERQMISERTKAGLQARKAAGVKLGRPRGSSLEGQADLIQEYLGKGLSKASIAKLIGCSRGTLYHYLETRGRKPKRTAKPERKAAPRIFKTGEDGFIQPEPEEEAAVLKALSKGLHYGR